MRDKGEGERQTDKTNRQRDAERHRLRNRQMEIENTTHKVCGTPTCPPAHFLVVHHLLSEC